MLGVDAIELKKAAVFYREHRARLSSFLNAYELRRLKRSTRPIRTLAEILAAKEALFKADARSGTGGFETVGLTPALRRRVSITANRRVVVASVKSCAGKS